MCVFWYFVVSLMLFYCPCILWFFGPSFVLFLCTVALLISLIVSCAYFIKMNPVITDFGHCAPVCLTVTVHMYVAYNHEGCKNYLYKQLKPSFIYIRGITRSNYYFKPLHFRLPSSTCVQNTDWKNFANRSSLDKIVRRLRAISNAVIENKSM